MIYNIQTFCTYGYWPDTDLTPKSGKPIIAACDICGKIRITTKAAYRNLCQPCAMEKVFEDPDTHINMSNSQTERYKDPTEREKQRQAQIKHHEEHPETVIKMTKSANKRWEDPKEHEKARDVANKHWEDPLEREKTRQGMIKLYENPEEREKQRQAQIKRYEDPKERKKISDGGKKSYKDDPMRAEKHRDLMKIHYAEVDDPGQDIVRHHYIYDHNDLSLYTMKMTRGQHTRLHHTLRRAKIEIPHINIKEV